MYYTKYYAKYYAKYYTDQKKNYVGIWVNYPRGNK